MTLYEKFEWKISVEDYLKDVMIIEDSLASSGPQWYDYKGLPTAEVNVAACYYLLGNLPKCRGFAARAVSHSLNYFYGSWREKFKTDDGTIDPDWWRRNISWIRHFWEAACFAVCLDDWASVQRIAEYPTNAYRPGTGFTDEDKAVTIALACYLQGDSKAEIKEFFEVIQRGKKQKPKLVAEVIRALQDKSTEAFQESLEAYLRYFRKSEFKKKALDKLLCLDGTTLLNIGEREGLKFKVPPELEDHIIWLKQ